MHAAIVPRDFASPNNPPGRVHTAWWPCGFSRNVQTCFVVTFPDFPTSAFSSACCSWCCCRCCCRGVHTATPCDLKSPFRYARQVCPRLLSHRGASAAAVLLSFRRDTTLPACSYAFTIGKFRRWWHSSPPCSTFSGWRLIPTRLPLCPALDAGLHINHLIESKALLQYPLP